MYDHFEYQVTLFDLLNALTSFQKYINKILAKKLDIFIIAFFNNIIIYKIDHGQLHVNVVYWVLKQLWKYSFFTNLKMYYVHQDKIYFLKFIVLVQEISIEEKKLEVVKVQPEPKSIRDIKVFLKFAKFYQRIIPSFSKIVILLTLILKTTLITNARILFKATNNSIFLTSKAKLVFFAAETDFYQSSYLTFF